MEEYRAKKNKELREALHLHRINDVRDECRATHIAYAFLRGHPFSCVERGDRNFWKTPAGATVWKRAKTMIEKYGDSGNDPMTWRESA